MSDALTELSRAAVTRGYRQGLFRVAEIVTADAEAHGLLIDARDLLAKIRLEIEVDDPGIFEMIIAEAAKT